jgi:hypothetical protein
VEFHLIVPDPVIPRVIVSRVHYGMVGIYCILHVPKSCLSISLLCLSASADHREWHRALPDTASC